MTALPKPRISEQEYIAFERASAIKHEYFDGRIYAMTGASAVHNLIAGNTLAALHGQLRGKPCQIFPSDMRVKVQQTGLYTYPDLVVVCGDLQFTDDALDTLLNPTVLIEILSPSTERYDRGLKFQHYRTIATLQHYILIAQDQYHIEHYLRQFDGQWLFAEATGVAAQVVIPAIDCALSLNDVYERVTLTAGSPAISRDIPRE